MSEKFSNEAIGRFVNRAASGLTNGGFKTLECNISVDGGSSFPSEVTFRAPVLGGFEVFIEKDHLLRGFGIRQSCFNPHFGDEFSFDGEGLSIRAGNAVLEIRAAETCGYS